MVVPAIDCDSSEPVSVKNISSGEEDHVLEILKQSRIFAFSDEKYLRPLLKNIRRVEYKKGDIIMAQGEPCHKMYFIADGSIVRYRRFNDGRVLQLERRQFGSSINSLHIMRGDPAYATSVCEENVVAYMISGPSMRNALRQSNQLTEDVIYSLSRDVRALIKQTDTPLFEQTGIVPQTPIFATSVAASIESFYRSGLNALINARLTGVRAAFFPNMHIQMPVRVLYINGFKGLRLYFDQTIDPRDYEHTDEVRMALAVGPGVIMTPVSSILEASNAGHSNPLPLYRSWMCGILPRGLREIIFGVGLNQLSDYCEEHMQFIHSKPLRNAAGSMVAGVISGYLSHVPHNLSTMKLMQPDKSYRQHFQAFAAQSEAALPETLSPAVRKVAGSALAVLAPRGCGIRTCQIVGSFMILNGTIQLLKDVEIPQLNTMTGGAKDTVEGAFKGVTNFIFKKKDQ